jgi:two-component system sensor histidine kinase/response regulator
MQEFPSKGEENAEAQLRSRHRGARVLLAEHNPINREVALGFLEAVGLAVDIAEDGQAAVEKALGQSFDLVLVDTQMPGMDGFAAGRAIRARPELARLPIVAMTAGDPEEDRAACLAAGMNDLVAQPMDPPAFYSTLLRHLDAAERGEAESRPAQSADPAEAAYACIRRISGLDSARGLKYAGGKWPLYATLLEMLARDDRAEVGRLRADLAAGEFEAAVRIVHSLKSTGATIGADALRERSAALEGALREGLKDPARFEPLCAALEAELARLCAAIRSCLGPAP